MNLLQRLLLFAAPSAYDQPFRPQYHFSPRQNWTNDPNGVVYFEGEYHLFFQYNPFGDQWGHMSWGHSVSRDLLHWAELPDALPEGNGVMIFTGSTVIDERNSSGFCTGGKPCMVAIYTGHTPAKNGKPALQTQNIAFSNNRGRTWTKYAGNPVLNLNLSDFRDPDVFWLNQSNRWIMAVSLPNEHRIRFYASADLKRWMQLSDFGPAGAVGGQWECPSFFELPIDGDAGRKRWVLKVGLNPGAVQGGSGEQYFVGTLDGVNFTNDNPATAKLWTDYGKDCYCALTFNHLPASHPPTMIGWMDNWQYASRLPTRPWRGQMTIPREVALTTYPEGVRLVQRPTSAIRALGGPAMATPNSASFEIRATLEPGDAAEAGWKLVAADGSEVSIGYDRARDSVFVDRTRSRFASTIPHFASRTAGPLQGHPRAIRFDILVDRNSVEVFADSGRLSITNLVFSNPPYRVEFYSRGNARQSSFTITTLQSVWTSASR